MTKAFFTVALCALLLARSFPLEAQQPEESPPYRFLDPSNASGSAVLVDAFRQELTQARMD